jgi:hypothetical protein
LLILFGIIFPIFYCFYFLHISKTEYYLATESIHQIAWT